MKPSRLSALTGLVSLLTLGSGCSDDAPTPEVAPVEVVSVAEHQQEPALTPSVQSPKQTPLNPEYTTMTNANLQYPLVSVADRGTTQSVEEAAKVRKVAAYIINASTDIELVTYESPTSGVQQIQRTEAVLTVGSNIYTVLVVNLDETKSTDEYDQLNVTIIPKRSTKGSSPLEIIDRGLDGNVNYMASPYKKAMKLFDRTLLPDTKYTSDVGSKLENRELAQFLYTTALDKIIAFYETNK